MRRQRSSSSETHRLELLAGLLAAVLPGIAQAQADLQVVKVDGTDPVAAGNAQSYTITLKRPRRPDG
jgi:hypothetical protein